jgi:hypothetical protein
LEQPNEPQNLPPRAEKKPRISTRDSAIVVVCLIVLAIVLKNYFTSEPPPATSRASIAVVKPSVAPVALVDPVQPSASPVPEELAKEPLELYDDDITLVEDHYQYIPLTLTGERNHLSYEYSVTSGPNLDFYLLDENGLFKWKRMVSEGVKESGLKTFGDFASSATSRDFKEGDLVAGTYYLIVDNTDYGATIPPLNLEDDVTQLHMTIVSREN